MSVLLFFLMKRMFKNIIIIIGFSLIYRWATVKSSLGNHKFTIAQRRIRAFLPEISKKIGKAPERTFPI